MTVQLMMIKQKELNAINIKIYWKLQKNTNKSSNNLKNQSKNLITKLIDFSKIIFVYVSFNTDILYNKF